MYTGIILTGTPSLKSDDNQFKVALIVLFIVYPPE